MITVNHKPPNARPIRVTALALTGESVITAIHHLYGAITAQDLFRAHALAIVLGAGLVSGLLLRSYCRSPKVAVRRIFIGFAGIAYVLWLGVYEGAYNHGIKDVAYLAGAPPETLRKLYPIRFEVPHDLFFELTGALTFVAAVPVAWALIRLAKEGPVRWATAK